MHYLSFENSKIIELTIQVLITILNNCLMQLKEIWIWLVILQLTCFVSCPFSFSIIQWKKLDQIKFDFRIIETQILLGFLKNESWNNP